MADILEKDIIVTGFSVKPSKYENEYLTLQFRFEPEESLHIVFTGSTILTNQLRQYENKIPFITQIKEFITGERKGKYYSFV